MIIDSDMGKLLSTSSELAGLKMEAQRSCSHLLLRREWNNGGEKREGFPLMPHKSWAVGPKYRSVLSTAKFVFCLNYNRVTFLLITTERPPKKCLYLQRDHWIPVKSVCLIINTGKIPTL